MRHSVTPKRYYTFMIDEELAEALREAKQQSPELSEAAIIRQALRDWFAKHRVTVKKRTARPRKRAKRS
jgi:hypothetical protein